MLTISIYGHTVRYIPGGISRCSGWISLAPDHPDTWQTGTQFPPDLIPGMYIMQNTMRGGGMKIYREKN